MQRLDGPREKILGEWSSESVLDTTYDNGYRMILTAYERRAYNEDRTYDDEWHTLIKLEISFRDGSVRMYYYIHGNSKNSWSADNGLYVDSTMTTSFKDEVAPGNAIADKDMQTGKMRHYGLSNFPKEYDPKVIKMLQETYNAYGQSWKETCNEKKKVVYKIISLTDNQIIFEDNDDSKYTLNRGNIMSPRIQQMIAEGKALR